MAQRIYTIKSGLKPESMAAPAQPASVGAAGGVGDVALYNANTAGVPTANVAEVASAGQTAGRVYRKKNSLTMNNMSQVGQSATRTYAPKSAVVAEKIKYQTQSVQDWFKEAEAVAKDTTEYVSNNQGKWNAAYGSDYTERVGNLLASADDVASYIDYYLKEDEETYKATTDAFSQFKTYLADFDNYAAQMREDLGQFKSDEEYQKALAAAKEFEELLAVDVDGLENKIQFYNGILDMIAEHQEWQRMDVPNGYNLNEVRARLQDLESKLNYYGFPLYDIYGKPLWPEKEVEASLSEAEDLKEKAKQARVQNAVAGAKSDEDFQDYVSAGKNKDNPILANYDKIAGEMTKEQKNNYYYLRGKFGQEDAEIYFELVRDSIKAQHATDFYETYMKDKWYEGAFNVVQGLDSVSTGVQNAFGNHHTDDRLFDPQLVGSLVRENLSDTDLLYYDFKEGKWKEQKIFGSSLGQVLYDAGTNITAQLPAIGVGAASNLLIPGAGAYVTPTLMGVTAAGNSYKEALDMGYTPQQAREYALINGVSEIVMEKVLNGIGIAGDSLVGGALTKATSGIKNATVKNLMRFGGSLLSEGAEEWLQEILTPVYENIALDADNTWEDIDWEAAAYAGLLGAASAGVFNGTGIVTSVVQQHAQQNAQLRTVGRQFISGTNGLNIDKAIAIGLDNAKGTDAYNAAVKIQQRVRDGKSVSAYAVGRMVAQSQTEQAKTARAIERTVLSTAKEWSIPTDAAETVSAAAVSLGQKVEFVSPEGMHNRYMAGEYDSATDTVRLNAAERNVDKLIGAVLAHEMVHTAEGTDQLQKLAQIAERMENHKNGAGAWEKLQADVKRDYAKANKQLSDPEVKKEALAHWIAENLFQNKAFAKAVADGDANVGNAFFYLIDRVRRAMGVKKASAGNLAMLERLFMQALDNRTLGPREGDVQGAVNGAPVIDLSDHSELAKRVEGVPKGKKNEIIQQYILDALGKEPFRLSDGKMAVVDRSDARHIANFARSEMEVAQVAEIKKLVENARLYTDAPADGHGKFDHFWYYEAIVRYSNDEYSVFLNVGRTHNDRTYHLYDIMTENKRHRRLNEQPQRPKPNEGYAVRSGVSNTNVAQNSTDVNTQSMQEGAGISAQGALLSPESMEAVRNGTWREARVEGVQSESPRLPDGQTPPFRQGVQDAATSESASGAVRSQLQGRKQVDVSDLKKTNRRGQTHYDHDAAIDRLETELGKDEMLRRMYNATRMDRPKGIVEVDGRQVDAGAYMDAYERQLPDDVATLEQTVRHLEKQRTEEILRMEQEGKLGGYTFGGLKLDLQLFAAKRKYDLLQLDPGESGTEVRQFYEKRLRGTDANHNDELVEMLSGRTETYNPICNEETLADAKKYLDNKKNEDSLLQRIGEYNNDDLFDAKEVAAAIVLINRAVNDGDLGEAADMIIGLSRKGTIAGRAVQAYSMMARMTPEGTLKAAIRTMRAEADTIICKGASEKLDVLADDIVKAIEEAEDNGLSSKEIIDRIRKGVVGKDAPVQFDHVPQDLADQVSEATGTDVTGYTIVVSSEAMQAIVDGGANVETLVDTDAETLQIIVRDGTDIGTTETATAQQLTEGKKRLPAKLTREELVQLLSEDLAGENGNFFTQEEIHDLLWKTVNEAANVPEQVKRYVLKKIRKDDGGLAQRIYELHKRGDLKQVKLRRAMEEALELPHLTDEDLKWVVEKATEIQALDNAPVKQADAMDELYDYLGAKMHVSTLEMLAAWRKFSMLFNAKTHLRNIFSNFAYMGVRKMDSAIAMAIERVFVRDRSQWGAALGWSHTEHGQSIMPELKKQVELAVLEMQNRGPKYEQGTGQLKRHRKMFGTSKLGEKLNATSDWNSEWLEEEDIRFFRPAYIDALGQLMTARGVTEITTELHDIAMQRALEATFRNRNYISAWLSAPRRGLSSDKEFVRVMANLYDVAIPFVNTPAAVAEQAIWHSPIGIIKGAYEIWNATKGKGTKDIATAINTFSKGVTGTALFAIGILLGNAGLFHVGFGRTAKERAADEMEGLQDGALVIGDMSISLDWLQPAASPLIVGASLATNKREKGWSLSTVFGAVFDGTDSLFELTMLQSLYDLLGGYEAGPSGSMASIGENAVSQSTPTLMGQLARAIDPVQRKTKGDNAFETAVNKVIARIPGLTYLLDPELDVWGNEVYRTGKASTGSAVWNAIQQFVSPANAKIGTAKDDPISEEILRLYEGQGGAVIPTAVTRDEAAEMGEDYVDVNRLLGGANRLAVEEFVGNKKAYDVTVETGELTEKGNPRTKKETKYYRDMTDDERRKVLSRIYKATKAEVTGDTEGKTESQLTDSERYIRELLRRVQNGERGTFDGTSVPTSATTSAPAQPQQEQPLREDTSYYEDLLRRMKNGN
ncbi:MAG: hypothetical protein IJB36_04020 [Clostridia bacterium]|nr:hypothetical protein [Clostridia bacterium]